MSTQQIARKETKNNRMLVMRKQTISIRFWRTLRDYASAQWLKAHGWTEVRNGWLLPEWHPTLRIFKKNERWAAAYSISPARTAALLHLGEPYDLKHACNSQEAYTTNYRRTTSHPRNVAPAYPSYVMFRPFHWCITTLANSCLVGAYLAPFSWLAYSLLALSVAILLINVRLMLKARRDWQLDWAEEQLIKRGPNAIHNSN